MAFSKNELFLKYIELDAFWKRGNGWSSDIKRWLKWGELKDALLYGGVAKLSIPFLKNVEWWQIILVVLIVSFGQDFLFYFMGKFDFKKGLWKKQNEWGSKHATMNPFNAELKNQLNEHTKALSELTHREIPNCFKDL
jgi:hypothetical protein